MVIDLYKRLREDFSDPKTIRIGDKDVGFSTRNNGNLRVTQIPIRGVTKLREVNCKNEGGDTWSPDRYSGGYDPDADDGSYHPDAQYSCHDMCPSDKETACFS